MRWQMTTSAVAMLAAAVVRAVAEQEGIPMPSFHGYFIKYALAYLLPVML